MLRMLLRPLKKLPHINQTISERTVSSLPKHPPSKPKLNSTTRLVLSTVAMGAALGLTPAAREFLSFKLKSLPDKLNDGWIFDKIGYLNELPLSKIKAALPTVKELVQVLNTLKDWPPNDHKRQFLQRLGASFLREKVQTPEDLSLLCWSMCYPGNEPFMLDLLGHDKIMAILEQENAWQRFLHGIFCWNDHLQNLFGVLTDDDLRKTIKTYNDFFAMYGSLASKNTNAFVNRLGETHLKNILGNEFSTHFQQLQKKCDDFPRLIETLLRINLVSPENLNKLNSYKGSLTQLNEILDAFRGENLLNQDQFDFFLKNPNKLNDLTRLVEILDEYCEDNGTDLAGEPTPGGFYSDTPFRHHFLQTISDNIEHSNEILREIEKTGFNGDICKFVEKCVSDTPTSEFRMVPGGRSWF